MQKTRQKIIEYLREYGAATVDDLSRALGDLTAVTVRHHLDVLRSEGLVAPPEVRHRNAPGRPRYVYSLTEKAEALFPKNLSTFTSTMIETIKATLPPEQVDVILRGVATRMASELEPGPAGESFQARLERVVEHLSAHGYEANWERHNNGYMIHTCNCPYSGVAETHDDLCTVDTLYIERLLGVAPRRVTHVLEGDTTCSYLVSEPGGENTS